MRELDIHYLVVAFVGTVLTVPALTRIPIGDPLRELALLAISAAVINTCLVALSFVGIAPWGFTKRELYRCLIWIPTNLIAGTILTFLMLSSRAAYSGILYLSR